MASITSLTSPFLGIASTTEVSKHPSVTTARRGVMAVNAMRVQDTDSYAAEETTRNRRGLVFAAGAATACSVMKIATAEEEPKRGTEEAKKKYGPVCVTMPTARICHK